MKNSGYTYDFVEQQQNHMEPRWSILDEKYRSFLDERCGWVKLKRRQTTAGGGVTAGTDFRYAADLSTASPDNVAVSIHEANVREIGKNIQTYSGPELSGLSRAVICRSKTIPGPGADPLKDDCVLVRTNQDNNLNICIGLDVTGNLSDAAPMGTWSDYLYKDDVPFYQHVIGASIVRLNDGNSDDDLIIVSQPYNTDAYLVVVVYHDINVGADRKIHYSSTTLTLIRPNNYTPNSYNESPVGCMIGKFHGEPDKLDFMVLTNISIPSHNPGDLAIAEGRTIFAFVDFEEEDYGGDPYHYHLVPVWKTTKKYSYYGNACFLTNADGGGTLNDLVIVGPGYFSNGQIDANAYRPFAYQIFNNISLSGTGETPKTIMFYNNDNPCSNCPNNLSFKLQPDRDRVWDALKFSGVEHDETTDWQKIFFFSDNEDAAASNKYLLQLIDYHHVNHSNDFDGQPNRTCTRNSDGTQMMTVETPAYWKYGSIGDYGTSNNKHSLSQKCGVATYRYPSGVTIPDDLSDQNDKVVAAKAMTWYPFNGAWLPCANYVWRAPMNAAGLPVNTYIPFNYSAPTTSDISWKLTDSICKYTLNGLPKETAKPTSTGTGRLYTSIIYGHNSALPIGSVTNAQWEECGVYTADYRANSGHAEYWDYENGWEKGVTAGGRSTELLGNFKHFGDSVIFVVNNYAACRNNRILPGKAYIMSAWVRVTSGKLFMVSHYLSRTSGNGWPATGLSAEDGFGIDSVSMSSIQCAGEWKLLQLTIPASRTMGMTESGKQYFARTWIGNAGDFGNTAGVSAYIDDIRFAPANAMVTSTYYDPTLQKTVISIDPNNKPGKRITYDSFGRHTKTDKIEPSKSAGASGSSVAVQEKKYNLRNELPIGKNIQLLSPDGGTDYINTSMLTIRWINEGTRFVAFSYQLKTGSVWGAWLPLPGSTTNSGWGSIDWTTIPPGTANYCKIKVQCGPDIITDVDESDEPFFISVPASP